MTLCVFHSEISWVHAPATGAPAHASYASGETYSYVSSLVYYNYYI